MIPRPDRWEPGPPAAWMAPAAARGPLSVADVTAAMASVGRLEHPVEMAGARRSAVLVALVDGPDGAEVLLTRRSRRLSSHRGEMSFPGGRMDDGETPEDTARREAWEEVGLPIDAYDVVGELPHLTTFVSNSHIVPLVARLHARPELRPSPAEVERVMFVPIAELTRDDTHREERWWRGDLELAIQFFELDDETVWGATGRMLDDLLCRVYGVVRPRSGARFV